MFDKISEYLNSGDSCKIEYAKYVLEKEAEKARMSLKNKPDLVEEMFRRGEMSGMEYALYVIFICSLVAVPFLWSWYVH